MGHFSRVPSGRRFGAFRRINSRRMQSGTYLIIKLPPSADLGRLFFFFFASQDGTPTSMRSSIRGFHQYHRMSVPSVLGVDTLPQLPYALPLDEGHTNRGSDYLVRGFGPMATISEESSINCSN